MGKGRRKHRPQHTLRAEAYAFLSVLGKGGRSLCLTRAQVIVGAVRIFIEVEPEVIYLYII